MSPPPLASHFAALKDPRVERGKHHALVDILVIAFCAVLCGAGGWEDMEEFGRAKEGWLRERLGLGLAGGVPSDDTFRRLFARLDPEQFGRCLLSFARGLHARTGGEVVALDGKTLRHSFDAATGQAAVHLVSAWASEAGLSLGQMRVDGHSNEIVAIPALLRLLDITGCVVTADAMGCQRAVARQVVGQGGDYVLALKANQGTLHADVKLFFEDARAHGFYQEDPERRIAHGYSEATEKDHGRLETRRCWVVQGRELDWLAQRGEWAGLASVGAVECERRVGGRVTAVTRYFISSLSGAGKSGGVGRFARAVRAHWGIENRLHWVLDVGFGEDGCGVRRKHGPENLATLRKMALNLLRQDTASRRGLKARSKRAAWDHEYLLGMLLSQAAGGQGD